MLEPQDQLVLVGINECFRSAQTQTAALGDLQKIIKTAFWNN